MKKYIIPVLLLAGCTNPYTCYKIKAGQTITGPADAFCVSNEDLEYMVTKKYTNGDLIDMARFATNELKYTCSVERNATFADSFLLGGSYNYADGTKLSQLDYGYVCKTGTVESYENHMAKQEQLRAEEESVEKNRLAKLKEIEKKIGKKLCSYDDSQQYALYTRGTIPKNCAFKLGQFVILQQTSDGTLIKPDSQFSHHTLNDAYFVSSNKTDSTLADGQGVPNGYFENTGTYQHTSVHGAKKTVLKLKRLSTSTYDND